MLLLTALCAVDSLSLAAARAAHSGSCGVPVSDDAKFEDAQDEVVYELTEQFVLLAGAFGELAGRLSAVVEDQLQVIDVLGRVEARVAALEAARDRAPAAMPAEPDEGGAREALRREARQLSRRTRELVGESRALVNQSEPCATSQNSFRKNVTGRRTGRGHRRTRLPENARPRTAQPTTQWSRRASEQPEALIVLPPRQAGELRP